MTREIKFRAWVKSMKRFYNISGFSEKTDRTHGYKVVSLFFGDGFGTWGADDVILLQYTGLKDKSGKEIYEADIITCYAIQREVHDEIEDGEKVIVKYYEGYFYPFGYNAGWRSEVGNIEIIGNVYENPDLLEP